MLICIRKYSNSTLPYTNPTHAHTAKQQSGLVAARSTTVQAPPATTALSVAAADGRNGDDNNDGGRSRFARNSVVHQGGDIGYCALRERSHTAVAFAQSLHQSNDQVWV